MSATGFEEPDLTYTLPSAAPSSSAPPPPPPAHNAGEGSSRSGGVEVKVVRTFMRAGGENLMSVIFVCIVRS